MIGTEHDGLRFGARPSTDNLLTFVFRDGDRLVITVQFWREEHLLKHFEHAGRVFVVEIEAAELASILEELIATLDRDEGERLVG